MDFMSDEERHQRLKHNLAEWARAARSLSATLRPNSELDRAMQKLFDEYFSTA